MKLKNENNENKNAENKNDENNDENDDDEYKYSNEDIIDICDKLYRDELLSVFYADDFLDNKIIEGMKYVSKQMLENSDFRQIIEDAISSVESICEVTEISQTSEFENVKYEIVNTFFHKHLFYIFHKCICQHLTRGIIEQELLDELKTKINLNIE
jgi:hypothetical protein